MLLSESQNGDCRTVTDSLKFTKRQDNKHTLNQISLLSKPNPAKLLEKFLLPCSFWKLTFSEFDLYIFTFWALIDFIFM